MNRYSLSQIADITLGGTPKKAVNAYWGKGYKWASAADVAASTSRYLKATTEEITELGLRNSNTKLLPKNTVVITARGTVGELAMLPETMAFNQSCYGLNGHPDVDQTYLYYALKASMQEIKSQSYGAVFDTITIKSFENIFIPLPELKSQIRIARLLSAYDDLIDNNTRRIQILEEMAQLIYREWFVHYRFPGYENVRMVDSGTEFGEIPEGWTVRRLHEISSVSRGKSYRSSNLVDEGGLPFLTLKCIDRDGGFRYSDLKYYSGDFKKSQTAKAGDIIIALTDMTQERRIIGHVARVPVTNEKLFVMSMDLAKINANEENYQSFLYCTFRFSTISDKLKEYANGVNVLHLSPEHINNSEILIPDVLTLERFSEIFKPSINLIDNLNQKNILLKSYWDLLLPKLISGELDVSNLDIEIE